MHLGVGGLGLFVVNALSERFELVSVRDGVEAKTTYARGAMIEPLITAPTPRANGTTVRFRPDATIFRHPRVPRAALTQKFEDLTFLVRQLTLQWTFSGDELASAGLVGRVALGVPCGIDEIASHRASFETAKGPMDVEVALAWRTSSHDDQVKPVIDSFVNLGRTPGDGSHVDGLLDGVRAFLGGLRLPAAGAKDPSTAGLVAAVAVILADVKFGKPTKDRLETPEARALVAEATRSALERWAEAHPEAAAALRQRIPKR